MNKRAGCKTLYMGKVHCLSVHTSKCRLQLGLCHKSFLRSRTLRNCQSSVKTIMANITCGQRTGTNMDCITVTLQTLCFGFKYLCKQCRRRSNYTEYAF